MNKLLAASILMLAHAWALAAGQASYLTVDHVRVDKTGKGYVAFTADPEGTRPACVQSAWMRMFAFDTNSPAGRSIMALALSAKASGQPLYAKGSDDCATYGVMEDWSYGSVR